MPSLDVVRESAMATDLHQEIEALPMRYDSELGERGVNLSGGQKQRLTLARAIIRKTPVVIFDDSLSSVDAETEHRLVEQLEKTVEDRHHGGRTTIIISHRLASLKSAQRVVVFKNGEIEAVGNQEELLKPVQLIKNFLVYRLTKRDQRKMSLTPWFSGPVIVS